MKKIKLDRDQIKRYSLRILYFLGFVVVIFLSLIEPNMDFIAQKPKNTPDFLFENVKITQYDYGKQSWKLESKFATIDKDIDKAYLKTITGVFFRGDDPVLSVVAPKAELGMLNMNMTLFNATANLEIDGQKINLKSDTLSWNGVVQQFFGKNNIRIYTSGILLTGDYFLVDIPTNKLQLSENSRALISPEKIKYEK